MLSLAQNLSALLTSKLCFGPCFWCLMSSKLRRQCNRIEIAIVEISFQLQNTLHSAILADGNSWIMKKIKGNSRSTPWSSRNKAGSNIQAALTNPPNHRVLGKYTHYRHYHTKVYKANRIIICAYVSLHYLTLNTRPGLRLQEIQECRFLWHLVAIYSTLFHHTSNVTEILVEKTWPRLSLSWYCDGRLQREHGLSPCLERSYQGTSSAPCFYRFRRPALS